MCSVVMKMAVLFCVILCLAGAFGFNVDIPSRVVYRGNNNSMFGFTVQTHIDGNEKMILVGAPEDDSAHMTSLHRPGVVYRCTPGLRGYQRQSALDMCTEMVFDKKGGDNIDKEYQPIDRKSDQWFGATLSSTGRNGPIVACAPRYVSFVSARMQHRDPVGACFVASSSDARDVNEYSPCRSRFTSVDEASHGQRKTGVCQAGFSAAVSKDGQRLFMGAPGSFYWQGSTLSIDPSHSFNSFFMKIPKEGQVYSQSTSSRPVLISTPEASPKYDDSYMGYSLAVGDFAGKGEQGVAVGVPRGAGLTGLIVLYTWELKDIKNITGEQIGSYFGYCLAAGDIDGDGTDDLIVGAPMYSVKKSEGFEHGRIYIVYQGRDRSYSRYEHRTGEVSRGRFGFSLTSLGDINNDGFGDIAVGAPYGGENGRGVVYIYQGSERGIQETYSQAITAEEISPTMYTFGFSLSGGVDLDNNNYTDLAVGAYKSDSVVFLKARPVVKVMADVKFIGANKVISLTDKSCRMRNGTKTACSELMYCLKYDGINVDRHIEFNVSLDLDSKKITRKRILTERRETTYTTKVMLTRGEQQCGRIKVYLDEEIRDKLTPIEVKMTYKLTSQPAGNKVPPVLDQTQSIDHADSLTIQKNCGPDNVCIPDLRMSVSNVPEREYVLGSGENINITVTVENYGEDAFEAAYYLRLPAGVTYKKMERLDTDNPTAPLVYCSISNSDQPGNSSLRCDLGNPMSQGQKAVFRVVLDVDINATNMVLDMEANSTNPEESYRSSDNFNSLTINVLINARLLVTGSSDPPELHYNASQYNVTDWSESSKLGPRVIHKYRIKNDGPSVAEETEFFIMWPYQTIEGDHLMYMEVEPQPLGDVRCITNSFINPENMVVKDPYSFMLTEEKRVMLAGEFAYLYRDILNSQSRTYYEDGYNRGSQSNFNRQYTGGSQASRGSSNSYSNRQNGGSSTLYGSNRNQERGEGFSKEQEEYIRRQMIANAQGSGLLQGEGTIIREKNRTTTYQDGKVVYDSETSTEYGTLGREGERGSSFQSGNRQNYYGERAGSSQRSYVNQQNYGDNSFRQSGQYGGFVHHNLATTETVNNDISKASSTTFKDSGVISLKGSDEEDESDLGTYGAQSSNNQFKFGVVNVGDGSANSQSSQGGYSQSGGGYSQTGGGYAHQSGSHYSQSQSSREERYYSQSGHNARSSGQNEWERREATRRRRDAGDKEFESLLKKCQDKYKCAVVKCTAGRLLKDQEVWVATKARLNASVLNEISKDRPVILSSLMTARVTSLPLLGHPTTTVWSTGEAQTTINPQLAPAESGSIPLWVIILAAIVGALLLLLLIYALYKCGFFKRNRPSDHNERQPLNGRDEHL